MILPFPRPPQAQVPFAGIHTFARSAFAQLKSVRSGQVVVFGAPHESTGELRPGMRLGPPGIREASSAFVYPWQAAGTLVDIDSGSTLTWPARGKLLDIGDLELPASEPARIDDSIRKLSADLTGRGAFFVALGGDKCVTYPLFLGFAGALRRRKQSAALIVLSDDLALAEKHPVFGQHWHGTTLRRILDSKAIDPTRVVVAGLRGIQARSQWEYARKCGVRTISLQSLRTQGIAAAAQGAIKFAAGKKGEAIYLSIDIGVVDPGHAPGRGGIAPGGLTARELLDLARALTSGDIGALDVVGVAPADDIGGRAAALAAQTIIEVIAPRVFRPTKRNGS